MEKIINCSTFSLNFKNLGQIITFLLVLIVFLNFELFFSFDTTQLFFGIDVLTQQKRAKTQAELENSPQPNLINADSKKIPKVCQKVKKQFKTH